VTHPTQTKLRRAMKLPYVLHVLPGMYVGDVYAGQCFYDGAHSPSRPVTAKIVLRPAGMAWIELFDGDEKVGDCNDSFFCAWFTRVEGT